MNDASSRRLLVTVESPSGRHTVAIPQDAYVDDLIPSLVEACEGRQDSLGWTLRPKGEAPLPGTRTLRESGLFAGAVLILGEPDRDENAEADSKRAEVQAMDTGRTDDAAYIRLLGDAIVAPRLATSTVIAAISEHHGAGTTTVAVLLATLLGELRDDRLAVVDANPDSGALSHWLVPDNALSRDAYATLFRGSLTPDQVRAALVSASPKLSVLPAPIERASPAVAGAAGWSRLIEHLRHLNNIVILDCGAGIHRVVSQAALDAADQVVLVSKPRPAQADETTPDVEAMLRRGRTVVVVTNQAPKRARSARTAGLQHVTIAFEPHHAKRLRTRGFTWDRAPAAWQESMRELAAVLVGSRAALDQAVGEASRSLVNAEDAES